MLKDGNFKRVIICCSKVDLRKGIDGLASYVKLNYGLDTLERGTVFLFCGTRNDRIKALCYEGDGYTLALKRLSPGNRFQWPRTPKEAREISPEQFRLLMNGFAVEGSIREYYPEKDRK